MMNDPYQVLGVSREASDREIKKAYRTMSRKYHPDSYSEDTQKKWAEDKFRQVQEAYNQIVEERSGKSNGNYRGYGGQASGNYSEEDQHLMAAMNYIRARRYNEAINVLNSIPNRSARWYYFSSCANLGLGNNVVALDYAKKAVEMEPGNPEYMQYYQQLQRGGTASPFGGTPFGGGYGGYGGYGEEDFPKGARMFTLRRDDLEHFETWEVLEDGRELKKVRKYDPLHRRDEA